MAWNPFNRQNSSRSRLIATNEQSAIENERAEIARLEKANRKMLHALKKIQESLSGCSKCQSHVCGIEDGKFVAHAVALEKATAHYIEGLKVCCIEPSKEYNTMLSSCNSALHKWQTLLQDYTKADEKYEKCRSKEMSASNQQKMDQARKNVENAQSQFESHHTAVKNDMKSLPEQRSQLLRPLFEGYIQLQLNYWQVIEASLSDLATRLSNDSSPLDFDPSDNAQFTAFMHKHFNAIKNLSIVDY